MKNSDIHYVVAGKHAWNRRVFDEHIAPLPGQWHYIDDPQKLSHDWLSEVQPRYVFFLHWSSIVPETIVQDFECVCFHMTDVPYGRGGSPLQNLIIRGHETTQLTALRMTESVDAGPVYCKLELSLLGRAQTIYERATRLSATIVAQMVENQPTPTAQTGDVVVFKRRKPHESRIPEAYDLKKLHDFIRMLDADGYPHAFIEHNGYRLEFTDACLSDDGLEARVTILSKDQETL